MESYQHTVQFGFDAERRARWLSLHHLDDTDVELAQALHQRIIKPNLDQIVERFYDFLFSHPETSSQLDRPGQLARLQRTQAQYLLELGIDFRDEGYFENRLRVGATHRRVGLPLSLYQAAYAHLQGVLFTMLDEHLADVDLRTSLTKFIVKIVAFDMSLAVETYHFGQLQELEGALTHLRSEGQRLRHEALTDELTGIPNRRQILRELDRLLATDELVSVLMVDVDHFKKINDVHGHIVGDRVLADIAQRIRHGLRREDSVGRFGGEEFCVLLPGADLAEGEVIAERVRTRVARSPVTIDAEAITSTISVGCSTSVPGEDGEEVLSRADEALYRAKKAGRNRVIANKKG